VGDSKCESKKGMCESSDVLRVWIQCVKPRCADGNPLLPATVQHNKGRCCDAKGRLLFETWKGCQAERRSRRTHVGGGSKDAGVSVNEV
jgi:hypothetical protein